MSTRGIRRNLTLTLGFAAVFTVGFSAGRTTMTFAQRGEDVRREGRGGFGPFSSLLLTTLDGDRDGLLTGSEISNAPVSLRVLDKNGDGRIAGTELLPAGRGADGGFSERGRGRGDAPGETAPTSADELVETLMSFDANGDQRLTVAEVPERFRGLFDRADTNKDGSLAADEIKASAASTPEPATGEGRGRGGRGRGGPADPLLAALDTDHDGALSAEELTHAPDSLGTLDRNADGRLTSDETSPRFGPRRGGPGFER